MRILDILVKAPEERGWPVVQREGWNAAVCVVIEEREIPI